MGRTSPAAGPPGTQTRLVIPTADRAPTRGGQESEMTSSLTRRLPTAAALIAILALPAAASAQYQLPTLTSAARADSLHQAAAELVAAHRWGDAARLHRRSAELRDPEDPLG